MSFVAKKEKLSTAATIGRNGQTEKVREVDSQSKFGGHIILLEHVAKSKGVFSSHALLPHADALGRH
jgi:hypothetical protein